jgi:hypothetical protein
MANKKSVKFLATAIKIIYFMLKYFGWWLRQAQPPIEAHHYPVIYIRNAPARGNCFNVCFMV